MTVFAELAFITGNHTVATKLFVGVEVCAGSKATDLIVGALAQNRPVAEVIAFARHGVAVACARRWDVAPGTVTTTPGTIAATGLCASRCGGNAFSGRDTRVTTPCPISTTHCAGRPAPGTVTTTHCVTRVRLEKCHRQVLLTLQLFGDG